MRVVVGPLEIRKRTPVLDHPGPGTADSILRFPPFPPFISGVPHLSISQLGLIPNFDRGIAGKRLDPFRLAIGPSLDFPYGVIAI